MPFSGAQYRTDGIGETQSMALGPTFSIERATDS
jgi:hypothetical protein